MNIEACYNKMGADYAEVKSRLPSDAFIKRFALKFLRPHLRAARKEPR